MSMRVADMFAAMNSPLAVPPPKPAPVQGSFVAVDVETATPKYHSICQVGAVKFHDGVIVETYSTYVDPLEHFHESNISVHGIDALMVADSPSFTEILTPFDSFVGGLPLISHTAFDRASFTQACAVHKATLPGWEWFDSARVARKAWPQFAQRGYGLHNLAGYLGIKFEHHDAVEDARAAGEVVLHAMRHTGLSLDDLMTFSHSRSGRAFRVKDKAPPPNPNGRLVGQTIVFTGSLTLARPAAQRIAAELGMKVTTAVSKKTSIVVVGAQDLDVLVPGNTKSLKHLQAEALVAAGHPIRIMDEKDFEAMHANFG